MSEEVRVPYYGGWGYREGRISRVLDELKIHNEVKVGDAYVVRIPKIQGKILVNDKDRNATYVDYIVSVNSSVSMNDPASRIEWIKPNYLGGVFNG